MCLEERRRGTRLFGEGDPVGNFDGKMYVIITGSVSLSGESRITGKAMLEKGASFGDDAAFMHKATQPRTDTATCETACSLVVLRKAEYHQAILEYLEREYRPTTLFLK